jgi:hypothetical protein
VKARLVKFGRSEDRDIHLVIAATAARHYRRRTMIIELTNVHYHGAHELRLAHGVVHPN